MTGMTPTATYKKLSVIAHMSIVAVTRVNNVSIIRQNSKKWFFYGRNSVRYHIFFAVRQIPTQFDPSAWGISV